MKKSALLFFVTALLVVACDDSSKSDKGCEYGAQRCSAEGVKEVCNDGNWYKTEECIALGGTCIESDNKASCVYSDSDKIGDSDSILDADEKTDSDISDLDAVTDGDEIIDTDPVTDNDINDLDNIEDKDELTDNDLDATQDIDEIPDPDSDVPNLCAEKVCEEWQSCNQADGLCVLKDGKCAKNSDCTDLICGSFDHTCKTLPVLIADMKDLTLADESSWNGSDLSGFFISGDAKFTNIYNTEYASWDGFAYSNISDITTAGYENQYAAITGEGYDGAESYAVYYAGFNPGHKIEFDTTDGYSVKGIYITNTTYAYLSMLNGDGFSKKFGGVDGTDPDWFKIIIKGITAENAATEVSVEYYLADFRGETASDYIVDSWQFVDLSSLGNIKGITISFESTDNGEFGMNTPAYFAIGRIEK